MLKSGADTLDAVIAGVNIVELDPNDSSVGYGGLPNEDGVVELLEVPHLRFMLGVQGHPEELYSDNPAWARLFKAFIEACTTAPQVVHHVEIVEQARAI